MSDVEKISTRDSTKGGGDLIVYTYGPSGNCPVQAEGTFDGQPFYFRARGTNVTVEVGDWEWNGPRYEWPDAGWISEATALAYIDEAYGAWCRRSTEASTRRRELRDRNERRKMGIQAIWWAAALERAQGASDATRWLMSEASRYHEQTGNAKSQSPPPILSDSSGGTTP